MIDLDALRALLERSQSAADRAFVDGNVRMAWARTPPGDTATRASLEELHRQLADAASRGHAPMRARLADGTLRGEELRKVFDAVPALERDHVVEEVLGIAYPPLDEPVLERELVPYLPSGYDEIVHALDVTGLGPGDRLLDVGSGAGKVVLLARLLTGATSFGLEHDAALVDLAEGAARALAIDARFRRGDAREAPLDDADVVFMYIPFTGAPLAAVMARLVESVRFRFLCAGALDPARYALVPAGASKSWLEVYARREPAGAPPTASRGSSSP